MLAVSSHFGSASCFRGARVTAVATPGAPRSTASCSSRVHVEITLGAQVSGPYLMEVNGLEVHFIGN